MLMLVDGHALVHRAFHAIQPLSTSKGELVNAVYGFTSMLFKALNELKPDYVAVAFDKAAPTFRHVEYQEYKATRAPAPEGLHEQFARVRELVEALNIPIYEIDGFEADDVLGTLALQATEAHVPVVIVTGDADAMQLVSPNVRVMVPLRGFSETTIYDEAGVKARYGIAPSQVPDFKALKGDPSDNIKGVPGIGEKTAARLLAEFASVEALVERVGDAPPKLAPVIAQHAADALKSKRLATIVTDVPIRLDLSACRMGTYDRPRLVSLLRDLEFRSLLARIPEQRHEDVAAAVAVSVAASAGGPPQQMDLFGDVNPGAFDATSRPLVLPRGVDVGRQLGDYRAVDGVEALDEVVRALVGRPGFTVDVETTHVDPMRASLVGISLAGEPGVAYYVPVGHREGAQLAVELVAEKLRPLLADPALGKYGHNLKYDAIVLHRYGMPLAGFAFDTMLATYLLEPSQRALNLKDVAFTKLGVEMTPIVDLIGKGKSQITMAEVPIPVVAAYSGADADVTLRLMQKLEPELRQAGLWELFVGVEMPLVPVLTAMEEAGVALDIPFLRRMSATLAERIGELEAEIYSTAGHRFNINSTQQLANVLFQELKLPPSRRTKTGQSTDAETLEALRAAHPIVRLILDHRQLVKLKSTYVDALPALVNPRTNRVHTSFNQTGTTTGRLSSSDPNLQNIPIRTELGREVRRAFIAGEPDYSLLGADYSQIELRILAHVTQDERLLAAFRADEDIHAATASQIFGVKLREVTPEQRRMAKTTNFGVLYGISDYGLSQQLGIPRKEAAEFIQGYFAKYPTVRGYLDGTIRYAQEHGYVTTLLGRRRFIPEINVANQSIRSSAERMAVNTPIQGTAADIIKVAMIRVHAALQELGMRSRMVLQVHDELVFDAPDAELPELKRLVAETMEGALDLSVPLKVDVKTGKNWAELE